MLHFPSANSAAHRPAGRDVAVLAALLDDDIWAFSNCRVSAPGAPVAEVDNARLSTIMMISEWKGYGHRVRAAIDTGEPRLLDNGLIVPNPIEQVARQLNAVWAVLRSSTLPQHFSSAHQHDVQITQSVKVYGSLSNLAGAWIASSAQPR